MDLSELMTKIRTKEIPHFLIFFGEEQKIIDLYIDQIVNTIEAKRISCATVKEVVRRSGKKSLDKSRKLYIVSGDADFLKNENGWQKVKDQIKKDYLILRYTDLDKRSSFVKNNKKDLVEFTRLSPEVLQSYIDRILPEISEENASKLIDYCGNDYGRILLECDKIQQYHDYIADLTNGISIDDCFDDLNKEGLFTKEIGDVTFELTDAVLGGYTIKAIQKLDEAKRKGEPALRIISILYTGFRNLYAYSLLGKDKRGAAERTGMTNGELYGCRKNAGGYSAKELKRNMLFCEEVERGLKSGAVDEEIALEYTVFHCLK